MRPQLSWKSSRVSHRKAKRVHVSVRLEAKEREDGPLAPLGLAVVRRETAARRVPPVVKERSGYSASELASVAAMLVKLKQGKDQRPGKILSALEMLAEEDYESARRMEVVVERLLEELEE